MGRRRRRPRPIHKKVRDTLFFYIVLACTKLLRLIPRRAAIGLMRLLGSVLFLTAKKDRDNTIRHLTQAFGAEKSTAEIKAVARQVFLHFATVVADVTRMPVLLRQGIDNLVTIKEGVHHLEEAKAAGKGFIVLASHFGNWELLGAWLAGNGFPIKVVGSSMFDPRLDKIVVGTRNQAGYTNIARGKGTREIIRALKKGYALGMLIDQDTRVQGTFADFFGHPAHTPTGPAVLARKFDVPIVPVFMRLRRDLTYHLVCLPPLPLQHTDDEQHDIQVTTQQCNDVYERMIRRYPEQWVWMHRRWRKQPKKGAPS